MADGIEGASGAGGAATTTYTQEQVDALLAEKTEGLKAKAQELLTEAKRAKDALRNYDGVDPDEHKRLKAAAEEAERKKATAEGDFKSLEKQLIERHSAELTARDAKLTKVQSALERRLVKDELRKTIMDKGGIPDMADLLLEYGAKYVRVRETDHDFEAYVTDANGNQRVADSVGTAMNVAAFVESELMVKFPRAFAGTGSSGSGAAKSNGGAGGVRTIAAGDNAAFLANLEGIAKSQVSVV